MRAPRPAHLPQHMRGQPVSWTRYDDLFTERPEFDGLSFEARWHYVALIQACSRARRWNGQLPVVRARRASDVPDPDQCHEDLSAAGLVKIDDETIGLPYAVEHLPPKSIRNNAAASKVRMRRKRQHDAGNHSDCLPRNCPHAVTAHVTRNTGTGRDRKTGADEQPLHPPY